jgi:phage shock protein PspC (stress-responsive transcriptional regulator)
MTRMKVYCAPSPLAPPASKIPQNSLWYDLVKAAFVAILGVVITMILEKLAKYFIARLNQPAAAESTAPDTVPPPFLPPADPEEINLELSPVTLRGPSPPATISPQSSHGYDLAKAALVAIFGVVITVFLKKLANYFIARLTQPAAAEPAAPDTVPPPFLPPADPEEINLELSPLTLRGPSPRATISPQSSHAYGVVITVFLKKLANYFIARLNQPAAAEPAAPNTVPPPFLPPADPEEINLELSPVTLRGPSPPATISPQSSHGYDLAKAALVAIFGVVITVFLKKLANYFMRNQHAAAEPAGPATVQPPCLPPAVPEEIDLELSVVLPAGN